jgi:serine/threonine protein phosphatase 1
MYVAAGANAFRKAPPAREEKPVAQRSPRLGLGLLGMLSSASARAPAGQRVYAVGDVHGRADLLDILLEQISADAETHEGPDRPALVFLGDYIDRGLQARQVVDRLLGLPKAVFDLHFLRGNHEAALLEFLDRPESGMTWFGLGGAETMFSYGVRVPSPSASPRELRFASRALRAAIPHEHLRFFARLEPYVRLGDYLFVHAGLRPGRPLSQQTVEDMLEIRDPFLKSKARWPYVVVHGHSPVEQACRTHRRIALDTGAYATGKLSAVRLDGASVSFLST